MPPSKQLLIANKPVTVEVVPHPVDPMARIIRATDGNHIHEHTLTLGPVDGGVVELTLPALQKIYDDARQKAASHVAFKAAFQELEDQIQ